MERKHRLSIDLTDEQYETLKFNIPHGMMKVIFGIMIDDMCKMYNRYGQNFNIAVMSNTMSYDTLVRRYIERNEANGLDDSLQYHDN